MSEALRWESCSFAELSVDALYAVMALRQQVFVVEQNCAYLDADGYDAVAQHVMGWQGNVLAAYARIIPPKTKYDLCSIGRVATAASARGQGLGRVLMQEAMRCASAAHGNVPIFISAQEYLADSFYKNLGFTRTSDVYIEDGIPHVDMVCEAVQG